MIDQYKYTWKMVKPLIPIIFLAIWVVLFEDKIWPDWENEIPVKSFGRGEIQWEYDMNSCLLYTSPSPRDRSLSRMPSSA